MGRLNIGLTAMIDTNLLIKPNVGCLNPPVGRALGNPHNIQERYPFNWIAAYNNRHSR